MKKPSWRLRFRYWFDNVMSKGVASMLWFLGIFTVGFILLNAAIVFFLNEGDGGERPTVAEALWRTFVQTMSANDVVEGAGWPFRVVMLVVTVIGVLIVANLIGIINGAFDAKIGQLRKGRTPVLESGHTLIIGWNAKIIPILESLCEANASDRKSRIVVVADKDKEEMDDAIREKVGGSRYARIVTRSGDPLDQDDLLIGRPFEAKSVIILAAEQYPDSDARVMKIALALTRHPLRPNRHLHITGQIRNVRNLDVAQLAGSDGARWILGTEKVGQITAQTARQPGLSAVYSEILSFGGSEIYFVDEPSLVGSTYFDAQVAFPKAAVIGVDGEGLPRLNPPADTVIQPGERLVVVAEDDSLVRVGAPGAPDAAALSRSRGVPKKPEKTLVIGSNSCLSYVLRELDAYAAKGSTVTIASDVAVKGVGKYRNLAVTTVAADATDRDTLESLKPGAYDHVIVVAYSDDMEARQADTRTLVTLLHLRDMMERDGVHFNIVSEMLEEKTRRLAEVTRIDDFIVSDLLVSLMIAQVSQNPELADVFATLFSSEGAEVYLRPASAYVKAGVEVDFYTVLAGAKARGETAFGYLRAVDGADPEVVLNPDKAARVAFAERDRVVVIAED